MKQLTRHLSYECHMKKHIALGFLVVFLDHFIRLDPTSEKENLLCCHRHMNHFQSNTNRYTNHVDARKSPTLRVYMESQIKAHESVSPSGSEM